MEIIDILKSVESPVVIILVLAVITLWKQQVKLNQECRDELEECRDDRKELWNKLAGINIHKDTPKDAS